ncbi:MAG: HPr family phosphocarrier protein [Rhodospirillaceae bacterium]|nr:HPr family phosphocarrier protein [Rhodospirillaceae bacterium]
MDATTTPLVRNVRIRNERGLHARAAAKLVQTLSTFDAEVTVENDGMSISGRSIMGLMMLAAGPGTILLLTAKGPDAKAALTALAALVDSGFGET